MFFDELSKVFLSYLYALEAELEGGVRTPRPDVFGAEQMAV